MRPLNLKSSIAVYLFINNFSISCVKKSENTKTKSGICQQGSPDCDPTGNQEAPTGFTLGNYWNDYGIHSGTIHADDLIFAIPVPIEEPEETASKSKNTPMQSIAQAAGSLGKGIGRAILAPINFGRSLFTRKAVQSPNQQIEVHHQEIKPKKVLGYCWYAAPLIKIKEGEIPAIDWSNAAYLAPDLLTDAEIQTSKTEVIQMALEDAKDQLKKKKDITGSGVFGLSEIEINNVSEILDHAVGKNGDMGQSIFAIARKPLLNLGLKLAVKDYPDYIIKVIEKMSPYIYVASKNETVMKFLDPESKHRNVDGWLLRRAIDAHLFPVMLKQFERDNNKDSQTIAKELLNPLLGLESGLEFTFESKNLTSGTGVTPQSHLVFKTVAEAIYLAGWKKGALENLIPDTEAESEVKKQEIKNWFGHLREALKGTVTAVVGKEFKDRAGYCTNRNWVSDSTQTALEIRLSDVANRW